MVICVTPTSGPFFSNAASQIPIQTVVSSVPVQPKVMVGTVNVPISPSTPLSTTTVVTPPPLSGNMYHPLSHRMGGNHLLHMYLLFLVEPM